MKLQEGMILDFISRGHGLITRIAHSYESKSGEELEKLAFTLTQIIVTNRYECDALIDGKLYSMSITMHTVINHAGVQEEGMQRIEWKDLGYEYPGRSGLASIWPN